MSLAGHGLPRLHVVTDDAVLSRGAWLSQAVAVMEAGGAHVALHVRGPDSSAARVFELVAGLAPVARRTGALLTVNDRVDVALASRLGAVHLGKRSLPLADARRLLGQDALIGVSCHSAGEAAAAESEGADYVFGGTVFETPSHPGRPGSGPAGLRDIVAGSDRIPVLGIGGVDAARVERLVRAGAYGVCALRGVWDAPDPGSAVSEYISALSEGVTGEMERWRADNGR